MSTLTLVTGTGRSGTSTMAGTLHYLGLDVPGPWYEANASNPKGFFENSWAMDFHIRILREVVVADVDNRPSAHAKVRAGIGPDQREELTVFLARLDELPQLVIKDPRTIWTQWLWREVAESLGREIRYLSMLRHPAEVVSSRTSHYNIQQQSDARFHTKNVARWINNSLTNERETRDGIRAYVRYPDLLADWRLVMERLGKQLGLTYSVDVTSDEHCEVDDWIEPSLRRHDPSWDHLTVPAALVELAEAVWTEVNVLADNDGVDAGASARLDEIGERYEQLIAEAVNINQDQLHAARVLGRRRGWEEARQEQREDQDAGPGDDGDESASGSDSVLR